METKYQKTAGEFNFSNIQYFGGTKIILLQGIFHRQLVKCK